MLAAGATGWALGLALVGIGVVLLVAIVGSRDAAREDAWERQLRQAAQEAGWVDATLMKDPGRRMLSGERRVLVPSSSGLPHRRPTSSGRPVHAASPTRCRVSTTRGRPRPTQACARRSRPSSTQSDEAPGARTHHESRGREGRTTLGIAPRRTRSPATSEGSPLVGRRLRLRLRNFRPGADSYLASLGGPLPYMQRLRMIADETADHERSLELAWRELAHECRGDAGAFERRWRRLAAEWNFVAVNALIEKHNRYFPAESRLPMDPRTGDFVLIQGEPYRRQPLGRVDPRALSAPVAPAAA